MSDDLERQMQEIRTRQHQQYLQQLQQRSPPVEAHVSHTPTQNTSTSMDCDPAVDDGFSEQHLQHREQEREPWLEEDEELARRLQEEEDRAAHEQVRPPMHSSDEPERLVGNNGAPVAQTHEFEADGFQGYHYPPRDRAPESQAQQGGSWGMPVVGRAYDSVRRWWTGSDSAPAPAAATLSQEDQDAELARRLQEEEELAARGSPQFAPRRVGSVDPGIPSFFEMFNSVANPNGGSTRFQMQTGGAGTFSFSYSGPSTRQTVVFRRGPNGAMERVVHRHSSGAEDYSDDELQSFENEQDAFAGFAGVPHPLFLPHMGPPFAFADPVDNMSYEQLLALQERLGHVPKGATQEQIAALPVSAFHAPAGGHSAEQRDTEVQQCNVCLEDFSPGEMLRTLPCLHRFHVACIDRWLPTNRSCPVCKVEVTL